ncbi:dihydrofolate reductase [Paenibacillus mesophilus]|uniref:dihydrofolate reductase n=1 Tax=Paenibacillus mesophilus TaxID=2582849 RepID=UPI00110D7E38|nr:dihydrofolate reductase [Paenibacillus mesophilus]TMV47232.1 dihydrofolate reductase [Paenibacillus mesophilus]
MSRRQPVSMIVAMDRNRVIGRNNKLPWRLPADLAFFKKTTMGHPVIMGRKTYESIGRPLPGRTNIILTRDPSYSAEGCEVAHTVEEALLAAEAQSPFIIGGSEIYALFFPIADRLYVTSIDEQFEGDAHFPEIDPEMWKIVARQPGTIDENNLHPHTFVTYERTDAPKENPHAQ